MLRLNTWKNNDANGSLPLAKKFDGCWLGRCQIRTKMDLQAGSLLKGIEVTNLALTKELLQVAAEIARGTWRRGFGYVQLLQGIDFVVAQCHHQRRFAWWCQATAKLSENDGSAIEDCRRCRRSRKCCTVEARLLSWRVVRETLVCGSIGGAVGFTKK